MVDWILPALGLGSYGRKQGKVLPVAITGTLRPSNSYYPSKADTYVWLTLDPLAPELVIVEKLLKGNFLIKPPRAVSRILEPFWDIVDL